MEGANSTQPLYACQRAAPPGENELLQLSIALLLAPDAVAILGQVVLG